VRLFVLIQAAGAGVLGMLPVFPTRVGGMALAHCVYNSASPAATTVQQLLALTASPHTGAVTVRTSLVDGFPHDDAVHVWRPVGRASTVNCLGYAPMAFRDYVRVCLCVCVFVCVLIEGRCHCQLLLLLWAWWVGWLCVPRPVAFKSRGSVRGTDVGGGGGGGRVPGRLSQCGTGPGPALPAACIHSWMCCLSCELRPEAPSRWC
jgi:hypothetical protein